ncbi:MAG: hypothetical protein ABID09_01535 [Candidatus Omnitrophota bacterium]
MNKTVLLIVVLLAIQSSIYARGDNVTAAETPKKEIKEVRDYFPLVSDSKYLYSCDFRGNQFLEGIVVRELILEEEGTGVYYFVKEKDVKKENPIVSNSIFGLGGYIKENDGLYAIEAFWREDLTEDAISTKEEIISFPPIKGETISISRSSKEQTMSFTVVGYEDMSVPAGEYKDCVKLKVEDAWPATNKKYVAYAWLAKDIGLIKLIHSTGRVDELLLLTVYEERDKLTDGIKEVIQ